MQSLKLYNKKLLSGKKSGQKYVIYVYFRNRKMQGYCTVNKKLFVFRLEEILNNLLDFVVVDR